MKSETMRHLLVKVAVVESDGTWVQMIPGQWDSLVVSSHDCTTGFYVGFSASGPKIYVPKQDSPIHLIHDASFSEISISGGTSGDKIAFLLEGDSQ